VSRSYLVCKTLLNITVSINIFKKFFFYLKHKMQEKTATIINNIPNKTQTFQILNVFISNFSCSALVRHKQIAVTASRQPRHH
jgi:hypothetical protein